MTMSAQQIADKHNAEVKAKAGNNGLRDQIKSYVDRLDNLETEKQAIADDIRDVCKEAKGNGLDPKALKAAVRRKREDADKRAKRVEFEGTMDQYLHALGILD